jgi:hypothetical protein
MEVIFFCPPHAFQLSSNVIIFYRHISNGAFSSDHNAKISRRQKLCCCFSTSLVPSLMFFIDADDYTSRTILMFIVGTWAKKENMMMMTLIGSFA